MMRSIYLLAIPAALLAQSTTTTYQSGINGERVAVASGSSTASSRTQTLNSVNGRPLPAAETV